MPNTHEHHLDRGEQYKHQSGRELMIVSILSTWSKNQTKGAENK